jgi:hypothetical protein
MPKRKVTPSQVTLLTGIVEDVLIGPTDKARRKAGPEVSIRVNILEGGDDGPLVAWMRVHRLLAARLRALAELQGPDGLMGRCCTIGVDERGLVVSLVL